MKLYKHLNFKIVEIFNLFISKIGWEQIVKNTFTLLPVFLTKRYHHSIVLIDIRNKKKISWIFLTQPTRKIYWYTMTYPQRKNHNN